MEEVRDCFGKLVSVADPVRGILEYSGTGRVRISVQFVPGCRIAIERNNSITVVECTG